MFQQTKDRRPAQTSPSTRPDDREPRRERAGARRRRLVALLTSVAVVCTLVAFGIGVTAQTRAEARLLELDERITLMQLRLQDHLEQVDDLTTRAADRQAQNEDARAALGSTEGFLE
ncbi:hypothetical protein [Microbacterium sp.]|uniref:hypothetical protein n=1 Tax=Microbacterium sp. TaxID=51671 RepID=UPI0037C7793B